MYRSGLLSFSCFGCELLDVVAPNVAQRLGPDSIYTRKTMTARRSASEMCNTINGSTNNNSS